MTEEKSRGVLEVSPANLLRWLHRKRYTDVAGRQRIPSDCLLARYFKDIGLGSIVTVQTEKSTVDGVTVSNPPWVRRLVRDFDSVISHARRKNSKDAGDPILVGTAITLVERAAYGG